MKITEVKSDTKVVVSKSNRNRIIDDRIKPPHMNRCFTCCISGRPNSGKSMLVSHWLKSPPSKGGYRKCFDSVIMVMPPSSRSALDDGKVMEQLDKKKVFDELTEDTCAEIEEIIDRTKEMGDDDEDDAPLPCCALRRLSCCPAFSAACSCLRVNIRCRA